MSYVVRLAMHEETRGAEGMVGLWDPLWLTLLFHTGEQRRRELKEKIQGTFTLPLFGPDQGGQTV